MSDKGKSVFVTGKFAQLYNSVVGLNCFANDAFDSYTEFKPLSLVLK
jgi:hypothetical protein